jgi:hypothetical protein
MPDIDRAVYFARCDREFFLESAKQCRRDALRYEAQGADVIASHCRGLKTGYEIAAGRARRISRALR